MASTIALPTEPTSTTFLKDLAAVQITPKESTVAHSRDGTEDSVMDDPLATSTSAPSSDDGMDDSTDNGTDFGDHTDHSRAQSFDDNQQSCHSDTVPQTTEQPLTPSPEQRQNVTLPAAEIISEGKPRAFDQGEQVAEKKSLSRPLSRQELRRKSSFFNSKDIAVSDQRYSSATYDSMKPIADPRFKSRFQSILSQWKARASA
ncbi:hypothetical protein BGX28_006568 [Mortierella sp. GBA30]|nr:hypothetical protein BGX28_006568 [Mortierella sp. GBA30]